MKRSLYVMMLASGIILAGTGGLSFAGPITTLTNGDFSTPGTPPDPFAAWTTTFGAAPTNGGGFALFSESTSFSQTELEQTFHIAPGTGQLSFEFLLSTSLSGVPGVPPDSFQATLYDAALNPFPTPVNPALPAYFSIDATGQQFLNSSFVSITTLITGWKRVTLNVSSLPPQDATLEFILNGSNDRRTTTVSLDNVTVTTSAAVPEPNHVPPLLVTALGWLAIRGSRRGVTWSRFRWRACGRG
jgi:hypothetical protein